MGYIVHCCDAAEDDLDRLRESDPEVADLWDVLIDELFQNHLLAYELTCERGSHAPQPHFDTMGVRAFLELQYNVARLKLYDPDSGRPLPQRLIYAIHNVGIDAGHIHLLGLMPRASGYDPQDTFGARIRNHYDQLGIPHIHCG